MTPLLKKTNQPLGGWLTTLGYFHAGSVNHLFAHSHRNRHIFWVWVCLSCPRGLSQCDCQRVCGVFDLLAWDPTWDCFRPRDLLYSKGGSCVGLWHKILWSYHILLHLETASLIGHWQRRAVLYMDGVPSSRMRYTHWINDFYVVVCPQQEEYMDTGIRE